MKCIYCGFYRGEEYFCCNCGAPKNFIDTKTKDIITEKQVQDDVAKLVEFCNIYHNTIISLNDITELAYLAGINGDSMYIKYMSKIAKSILDDRRCIREMYTGE